MSALFIDIGNTRMKWAFSNDAKVANQIQFNSQGNFSENFSSSLIELCLKNSWEIDEVICSSVSSVEQTHHIQKAFEKTYPKTIWKQINGLSLIEKITSAYLNPEQLGSDRRAMIIATQTLFPHKNTLIVSSGTATTLDIVTAQAHHLGGWILPGLSLMRDSLTQGTGRLAIDNSLTENEISIEIALDTQSAIIRGILASQLGAIEVANEYAKRKNIQLDLMLFTGGNGEQLLQYQNHNEKSLQFQYEDNLVLKGLMAWQQSI